MTSNDHRLILPARKLPPGKFSRSHDRYELSIPVTIEVLIPEDTFRPHDLLGSTLDVSTNGMQLRIDLLHVDLYSRLLARPRHVRMKFENPVTGEDIKITGRIAWIDYRKRRSGDTAGPCNIGVTFSAKDDGVNLTQYSRFIQEIQTS
jgi:hypothetical protein